MTQHIGIDLRGNITKNENFHICKKLFGAIGILEDKRFAWELPYFLLISVLMFWRDPRI